MWLSSYSPWFAPHPPRKVQVVTEAFFDPTSQQTEAEYFKRIAAAYRQRLAPMPDPEPDDYADLAEAAEYAIYNYLTQTSGASVESEGVSGINSKYVDFNTIKNTVKPIMGNYYTYGALRTRYIERA
jgi:hypothetical protein